MEGCMLDASNSGYSQVGSGPDNDLGGGGGKNAPKLPKIGGKTWCTEILKDGFI